MKRQERKQERKQEHTYLLLVIGTCYLLGILGLLFRNEEGNIMFDVLQKGFTVFPFVGALLTRKLSHDKERLWFSIKVWKNWKLWLICAVFPSILIGIGAKIYYMVFPQEYAGIFYYDKLGELFGIPLKGTIAIQDSFAFWRVIILISALFIPIQLLELGEEIGWRGYVLPKQVSLYGAQKAVLINGFWWGIAHIPLIYFGFNYSLDNWLAPWSNMLLMMLTCITLGIIMSHITIKTKNCMYASIIHGVINISGEIPVFLSVSGKSGLLGPNPTGLIGMSGLIVCAIVIYAVEMQLIKLKK